MGYTLDGILSRNQFEIIETYFTIGFESVPVERPFSFRSENIEVPREGHTYILLLLRQKKNQTPLLIAPQLYQ